MFLRLPLQVAARQRHTAISGSGSSPSSSSCRCDAVRFVPALSRFVACFRVGMTTSDLEEEGASTVAALAGGGESRRRLVVGRPFFLKKGTFTSVLAMAGVGGCRKLRT